MKKLILLCACAGLLVSCKSFNASVYQAENLAADTAVGGLKIWASYYKQNTNGAPLPVIAALDIKANQVNKASREFGTVLAITEELRVAYGTNTTVKPMLRASVVALENQSSNIVQLVHQFIKF